MKIQLVTKSTASKLLKISRVFIDKLIADKKINEYFSATKQKNLVGWINIREIENLIKI